MNGPTTGMRSGANSSLLRLSNERRIVAAPSETPYARAKSEKPVTMRGLLERSSIL
jgi:hypothetical protein